MYFECSAVCTYPNDAVIDHDAFFCDWATRVRVFKLSLISISLLFVPFRVLINIAVFIAFKIFTRVQTFPRSFGVSLSSRHFGWVCGL